MKTDPVTGKRVPRPKRPGARSKVDGLPCTRCGVIHVKCSGHNRKGMACNREPAPGHRSCNLHGGRNPVAIANAERRVAFAAAEGKIAELLRAADLPEQHPIDGLLEVVRHTGAMMRVISLMVSKLDDDPSITTYEDNDGVKHWRASTDALYGFDHTGDQAPNVLISLYEKWLRLHREACKTALDANIDERLVRNAENTSSLVFTAVSRALTHAELTPDQQQRFTATLATELRNLLSPMDNRKKEPALEGEVVDG